MQPSLYRKILFSSLSFLMILALAVIAKSIFLREFLKSLPPGSRTVRLCETVYGPYQDTIEQRAQLIAQQEADLKVQISGSIQKIYVEPGQYVHKGENIAMIENKALELERKAAIEQYEWAKTYYERMMELFEKGAISQQDYELSWNQYCVSKSQKSRAEHNYNLSFIIAPFDGYVSDFSWKSGFSVQAGDLFCTIANLDIFEIVAALSKRSADSLGNLVAAQWWYDHHAYSVDMWTREPFFHPISQKGMVRFLLRANPVDRLYPGLWGKLHLNIEVPDPAWSAPLEALSSDREGLCVWTAQKNLKNEWVAKRVGIDVLLTEKDKFYFRTVGSDVLDVSKVIIQGHGSIMTGDHLEIQI